ncbi:MAG: DUF58 domain-containing protein [Planctomycetes bacterium]|nr:DUF58 domain-containing protein [Planctomycetota bacterium]
MSEGSRFLDPKILTQLPDIELIARRLVHGMFIGYHRSPYYGYSVEFADHREYTQGDDVRKIDWKVWGKSDRYFIKRFEMESNLRCFCILDTSASMDYAGDGITKLEYGCFLAASMAYLMMHQHDQVGLVTFDRQVRDLVPARGNRAHRRLLLDRLAKIRPGPGTDVPSILHELAERLPQRALLVVISDCFGSPEAISHAFEHLRFRKHDLILFHTLDRYELELPYEALSDFVDAESGRRLPVDPLVDRPGYLERITRFQQDMREACHKNQMDYVLANTSEPIEKMLFQYLLRRAGAA